MVLAAVAAGDVAAALRVLALPALTRIEDAAEAPFEDRRIRILAERRETCARIRAERQPA